MRRLAVAGRDIFRTGNTRRLGVDWKPVEYLLQEQHRLGPDFLSVDLRHLAQIKRGDCAAEKQLRGRHLLLHLGADAVNPGLWRCSS